MRILSQGAFLAIFGLFTAAVSAVETSKCPEAFTIGISKISTFKTSKYSELAGWEAARDTLENNKQDLKIEFVVSGKTANSCAYKSNSAVRAYARLLTIRMQDPEEAEDYPVDKLKVEFLIEKSSYSLFLDVTEYSNSTLKLFPATGPNGRNSVRTKVEGESRPVDIEVGRARVDVL